MQELEPLILRFDVEDKGGDKVDRIGNKVEDLGKKLTVTEGKGKGLSNAFGGLGAVLTKIPGPLGMVSSASTLLSGAFGRVGGAAGSLGAIFTKIPGPMGMVSSAANLLTGAFGRVGGAAGAMGAILAKIPGPMGIVSGAANFMAASFRRVQAAILSVRTLFIGLGAAFAAWSFISAASQVEQYRLRLRQLTGDVEEGNRIFDDAAKYASSVSFAYREVLDSAVKLRTVVAQTPEQTAALVRLAGDIAGATGRGLEETTEQLSRALSAGIGSADMWRQRGISAMLGFQAGVSYTAEETARIISDKWLAMDSEIRGAATNLADTFAGQMSMLGDKWFQFRTMVMEAGLFDTIKDGLKGINAILDSLMKENKDLIEGAIAGFSDGVRTVAATIGPIILRIGTFVPLIVALIKDAIEGVKVGIVGVAYAGTWAAEMITGAIQKIWELIQTIIEAVRSFFRELASQTRGLWGLSYISRSANAMDRALTGPNEIARLGAETSKANAEAARSWKDYFSSTFDSILGRFEERGKLLRELRKERGEDPGGVVGATNIGLALEERGGLMNALFGQNETVNRLMEAFNRGVAGKSVVQDTVEARERDAATLQGLIHAQNNTADLILEQARQRAESIEGLLNQLHTGIEQMRRQSLAQSSAGLRQLFEEDMGALRSAMVELGIFQDYEEEFLEYRRLAWESTSDAIIAAMRREEAERNRQKVLSDDYIGGLKGGIQEWVETVGSGYQQASRSMVDALNAGRSAMADFLVEVSNDASSIKDHLRNMALSIVQSLQRIAAQALATAAILAILGIFTGGAAPAAMSASYGLGNAAGGAEWGFISGTYHSGGLVGGAPFRMPSSNGPAPDEVSAVLQRGEYVVSRRGVDALDRLNAGDTSAISGRGTERQVDRAVIIAEEDILTFAERSGRFRQAIVQITREDGGAR